MADFKYFLLNENKVYLNKKVGDILSALHELQDEMESIGSRDLNRVSEQIVSQIRRILHTNWPKENAPILKNLQKIGVSIMKAMDEKGDLQSVIVSSSQLLEKLTAKSGTPINKLVNTKDVEPEEKSVNKPEDKEIQKEYPDEPVTLDKANVDPTGESPQLSQAAMTATQPNQLSVI